MRNRYDVLIVGAGHGGAQAAIALRQSGFRGTIAIVGDEPDLPYERPPLSKDYLSGEKGFQRILIRPADFWSKKQVKMILGVRVVSVDPTAHEITTDTGDRLAYRALIWAGGGSPRRLTCSGHDLAGVHGVRNRADVDRIIFELASVERVCVIGGGYIGLEAAAVLRKLGKQVTLLEAMPRVLARVAGEQLSRFYEGEHRAHGVDLRLGAAVKCIEERDGRVGGVRLEDGEVIACEMAIVGIGIIPAIQPLINAGATGTNGVDVDAFSRTSLPDIYAVGDCAAHENDFAGGARIRVESVQNAADQAVTAARAVMGDLKPYHAVPWFWSNQYDLRLQTAGLSSGHDDAVLRGDTVNRSFSIVYLKAGKIVGIDSVNATKDFVQGRKLVEDGALMEAEMIANTDIALKDCVRTAV